MGRRRTLLDAIESEEEEEEEEELLQGVSG